MGGNLSFSLQRGAQCISLNDADRIEARYRAGSRIYHISDSLLGKGTLTITAQACYTEDAALWQVSAKDMPADIALQWLYGGASGGRFSREGDMGVDPIDCFHLKPAYCKGNDYSLQGDGFKVVFRFSGDRGNGKSAFGTDSGYFCQSKRIQCSRGGRLCPGRGNLGRRRLRRLYVLCQMGGGSGSKDRRRF